MTITSEKFTKGQWVADGTVVYRDNGVQPHICTMTDYFDEETTEANAVLIAAAPDMYETLDEVLQTLDKYCDMRYAELRSKVFQALSKATNL